MTYSDEFYNKIEDGSQYAGKIVLDILFEFIKTPKTAVDVGCGIGTWVSLLLDAGVEAKGIDGSWVNKEMLVIPEKHFMPLDIKSGLHLDSRFDLALCLEVAEHLPKENAEILVGDLTRLSDLILFSAAIPGQRGVNHINEQWVEYWKNLFGQHGFQGLDLIRPRIWQDDLIPYWYRQNILLYCKKDQITRLNISSDLIPYISPRSIVHPTLFKNIYSSRSVKRLISYFYRFISLNLKRLFPEKNS